MATLSVIIPAYNSLADTLRCVNTLGAFGVLQNDLLIQDDCSPDVEYAPELIPQASIQRNPRNLGFAGNCNAGAMRAQGDILLFVNQDVYGVAEWSRGWDAGILKAFERPNVGIVGARLLFPDGRVQSVGGIFDAKGQPWHRCLGYLDPNYPEYDHAQPVSWTTGAALAIRRDLFLHVGGFDTAYLGGYWEDVDLCMKARAAGAEIWYTPDCTLVHKVGSSGGNPEYFGRNARLFKRRWVDSGVIKADVNAVYAGWW